MNAGKAALSVVVAARNAAAHVTGCIEALVAQELPLRDLVVVDDASSDATAELAAAAGASVIPLSQRKGPAGARNVGARATSGDFLAFVDSDAEVQRGWAEAIVQRFDAGADVVAGGLVNASPRTVLERLNNGRPYAHDLTAGNGFLPGASSANLAIRRSLFEDLGGFDAALLTGEDHDLVYRAQLRGHNITDAAEAVAVQHNRHTLAALVLNQAQSRSRPRKLEEAPGFAEVSVGELRPAPAGSSEGRGGRHRVVSGVASLLACRAAGATASLCVGFDDLEGELVQLGHQLSDAS